MTDSLAPHPGESSFEADVRTFHRMTGSPVASGKPSLAAETISRERLVARSDFLVEEILEGLAAAHGPLVEQIMQAAWDEAKRVALTSDHQPDVVGFADSLADSVYIIAGTALETAIPLGRVFAEVQRSNMTKALPDGTVLKRPDGKVVKPANYEPPNIAAVLDAYEATPTFSVEDVSDLWNEAVSEHAAGSSRDNEVLVVVQFAAALHLECDYDTASLAWQAAHEANDAGQDPVVALARGLGAYVDDGAKHIVVVDPNKPVTS